MTSIASANSQLYGAGQTAFFSTTEWDALRHAAALSSRQSEISLLILANLSEAQIAASLEVSSHTVHSHLERLYRKMKVRSRSELLVELFRTYVRLNGEQARNARETRVNHPIQRAAQGERPLS